MKGGSRMPLFWTKPLDKEKKNTKIEPLTLKSSVIKEKAGPLWLSKIHDKTEFPTQAI